MIVHADARAARALDAALAAAGWSVTRVSGGEAALKAIDLLVPDALIADLRTPQADGLALLAHARSVQPEVCAVVIADGARAEVAVDAIRLGAWDVQSRPVQLDRLLAVLARGREHQALVGRVAAMEEALAKRYGADVLAGRSRAMQRLAEQIRLLAPTRAAAAVLGEAGTGKGEVARALHHGSARHAGPFIAVDASTLGEASAYGELFGVEAAGAAPTPRTGWLELADGGTLFIESFTALPSPAQLGLSRFLQAREFVHVGSSAPRHADVRLVVSSETDLEAEVRAGRLREPLVRMLLARIVVPPLRERREDLPVLIDAFVREFNREHGRSVKGVTPGLLERLVAHDWPGNVRELRNTIEALVVGAEGRHALDVSALPDALRGREAPATHFAITVGMTVEEVERRLIEATLRHVSWDKPRAAAMLGIGLRTLYRRITTLGLRPPR